MPDTSLDDADPRFGGVSSTSGRVDFDLVLVVGSSPVNRVVVSKIAERMGLRAIAAEPEAAPATLFASNPGTVILDGGADGRECDSVIEGLAAQRLAAGGRAPVVILLQNPVPSHGQPPKGGTIDAIVAKPISPDRLQPLIRSMIDRVRG